MAPPKGTPKVKAEGTLVYYGPDDDAQYDVLPAFLRKKVDEQLGEAPATSMTGAKTTSPRSATSTTDAEADAIAAQQVQKAAGGDDFNDEIPF
jgi:hypothetical protein